MVAILEMPHNVAYLKSVAHGFTKLHAKSLSFIIYCTLLCCLAVWFYCTQFLHRSYFSPYFVISPQMESTLSELHSGLHPLKSMTDIDELKKAMKGQGSSGELWRLKYRDRGGTVRWRTRPGKVKGYMIITVQGQEVY